jgi:hypothetical protein
MKLVRCELYEINIDKTQVITFFRKTNILIYEHTFFQSTVTRADSVKDLGIYLDSKLHFHNHAHFIFSQRNLQLLIP